jgi:hypothetical protein
MISRDAGPSGIRLSSQYPIHSLSTRVRNKKHVKNSDLSSYIESCLFQNKKNLPSISKAIQKAFPLKLSKPIHTLNVPSMFPNSNVLVTKLLKKSPKDKKKVPIYSELRKNYKKQRREKVDVSKSLDDKFLMNIKGFAEIRPKSVMISKKKSFVMQTEDF